MVQLSQTSWQEYSLSNVMETLRYAPMNIAIGSAPVFHYTLPSQLEPGSEIRYHVQIGFKGISWTGIISSFSDNKITVRLGEGPFRGFTATHSFVSEGTITTCHDEMSFQGFTTIPEELFSSVMNKASIVYGIPARKATRDVFMAVEAQKKTQAFEALDQGAAVG